MAIPGRADGLTNLTTNSTTGSLTLRNGRVLTVPSFTQSGVVVVGPGAGSKLQTTNAFTQTAGSTALMSVDSTLQSGGVTTVSGGVLRGLGTAQAGGTGVTVSGSGRLEPGIAGPGTLAISGKLLCRPAESWRSTPTAPRPDRPIS